MLGLKLLYLFDHQASDVSSQDRDAAAQAINGPDHQLHARLPD